MNSWLSRGALDIDYSDNGKTWTIIHWPTEIIVATNHIFRLLRSSAVTSANYYYPFFSRSVTNQIVGISKCKSTDFSVLLQIDDTLILLVVSIRGKEKKFIGSSFLVNRKIVV